MDNNKRFNEGISMKSLRFKDEIVEKIYQIHSHSTSLAATKNILYMQIIITLATIFILGIIHFFIADNQEDVERFTNISIFNFIIIAAILLEIVLNMAGMRVLRGWLLILSLLIFEIFFVHLTFQEAEHSMAAISILVLIVGQNIAYSWVSASLCVLIGNIVHIALEYFVIDDIYTYASIMYTVLAVILLNCSFYWRELGNRKLYYLLQEKDNEWIGVINQLPEGILIDSRNGEPKYRNTTIEKMCSEVGLKEAELITELQIHENYHDLPIKYFHNISSETGISNTSKNSMMTLELQMYPITFGTEDCEIFLLKDQTNLKRIQRAALQQEYQNMLICTISHELRTPLNGMVGNIQLLSSNLNLKASHDNYSQINSTTLINQELCEAISVSINLLWFMVNGILVLSELESHTLIFDYQLRPLLPTVNSCVDLIQTQIKDRGLQFILETDFSHQEKFKFDQAKLQLILINLLLNAAKYTFTGYIKLSISKEHTIGQEDNKFILFSVEDTGIGIDERTQATLFTMFGKLQNNEQRNNSLVHGTGLGTTVSKRLVERMKGEFWFTSKLGKGSKFNFYLPLEEFAEDDEEQDILDSEEISCVLSIPSEAFIHNIKSRLVTEMVADNVSEHIDVDPFSLPPPIPLDSPILLPSLHNLPSKVLIVDDNSMNIFALKMLLTKLNVQTVSAFNGKEGIEEFKRNDNYRLVFMDCNMPIMDGFEAASILKCEMQNGALAKTPIVALTAYASKKVRTKCFQAGMDDFLTKPIGLQRLKQILSLYSIPYSVHED